MIAVSSLYTQGRTTPSVTTAGSDGSAIACAAGAAGSGLPKSGAAVNAPTGFQSAKFLTISRPNSAGSMSPEMMTTVFSGRYQRSWNALMLAPVAASSVLMLPIGDRSASGWPAKKVDRIASPIRTWGPGCSRCSASTTGRSAVTVASVSTGCSIIPDRIFRLSSSPASLAEGRSSL